MPVFLKKIPHVLVMITPTSQKVLREKTRGIMRYAQLHGPWDVQFTDGCPFITRPDTLKSWKPDGIITREAPDVLAARIPGAQRIPTVFFDAPSALPGRYPSVHHDVRQAGQAVADFYLQQRLTHFAYVGAVADPQPFWSSERGEAFAARVRLKGHACAFYRPAGSEDWGVEQRNMTAWLAALPKPCGLFAAFDPLAKQVLDACLAAGIRVPGDLAVISVDDDETICENTVPTLSSCRSDYEGGAWLAAELLDGLMRRKIRRPPVVLIYGFKQLVHRQSSLVVPKTSRCVAEAMEFIRLNACEGIAVADVARHLRISRSHIEKQFKKTMGRSVLEEIQTRRLERLCALLCETTLSIGEIGERCGYATETYLKRLFKKRFGTTMREYRRRANG
jgi:LacI family transcriptional regulator